ncbi:putative type IX sorting system protein PorV2 [Portibacter marinus]|uniref:putative type IX sorting system protein PorV2 n=1 Tax=Portibacter marinus TaxID=2898660 RepID=UPI001F2DEC60|nr:PorV/PorQ family protein [Portibacter marinus]
MKQSTLLYLIPCLFLGLSQLEAQKFVNEFLNIGAGARAHGMSGAVIASTADGTAGIWNPAGLTNVDASLQVNAMHAEWFAGVANYDYGSIVKRFDEEKKAYGSVSVVRFGVDNIPYTLNLIGPDGSVNYDNVSSFSAVDYAVFLSYGRSIFSDNLRLGGSVKVINRSVGQFANAWGFGVDVGLNYHLRNLTFAAMAQDVTTTYNTWSFNFTEEEKAVFAATGNEIVTSSTEIALPKLILGAAYHSAKNLEESPQFEYTIEANVRFSTDGRASGIGTANFNLDPAIGAELGYKGLVFIRAGIGDVERKLNEINGSRDFSMKPNVGLGLKLGRLGVDYALTNIGALGQENGALYSHIFSLSLDFNPKSN